MSFPLLCILDCSSKISISQKNGLLIIEDQEIIAFFLFLSLFLSHHDSPALLRELRIDRINFRGSSGHPQSTRYQHDTCVYILSTLFCRYPITIPFDVFPPRSRSSLLRCVFLFLILEAFSVGHLCLNRPSTFNPISFFISLYFPSNQRENKHRTTMYNSSILKNL